MVLRKARSYDLDRIMSILSDGRASIAALGIDQWQGGYPHREAIEHDIHSGSSYVLEDEKGCLIATAMIGFKGEKDYLVIEDGSWLTPSQLEDPCYAVVHRLAVSKDSKGKGAAVFLLKEAETIALEGGCKSVRIDTHPGNGPMNNLLHKAGYTRCGIIYIEHAEESTPERVAYEKLLDES